MSIHQRETFFQIFSPAVPFTLLVGTVLVIATGRWSSLGAPVRWILIVCGVIAYTLLVTISSSYHYKSRFLAFDTIKLVTYFATPFAIWCALYVARHGVLIDRVFAFVVLAFCAYRLALLGRQLSWFIAMR